MRGGAPQYSNRICAEEAVKILEDYPSGMTTRALIEALIQRKVSRAKVLTVRGFSRELFLAMDDGRLPIFCTGSYAGVDYKSRRLWYHNKYKNDKV